MRKSLNLLLPLAIIAAGCGGDSNTGNSGFYSNDVHNEQQRQQLVADATKALSAGAAPQVTRGVNNLGFNLLEKLTKANKGENVCVSPVSVDLALGMVYNGAAGETAKGMTEALGLQKLGTEDVNVAQKNLKSVLLNADPKVQLLIANSLWVQNGVDVDPEFLSKNQNYFGAKVENVNFETPEGIKSINDWVSEGTGGKIKTILEKPRKDVDLLAVNAIYFKGLWSDPFKKENTKDGEFTLSDGKKKSVPMMSRSGKYGYGKIDNSQLVSIPYGSGRLAMTIVLPNTTAEIPKMLEKLDAKDWTKWVDATTVRQLDLTIPKWQSKFETSLVGPLKAMGMAAAFDPKKADFKGIRPKGGLVISDVIHKTMIDVNEEGTEAAAATGAVMMPTAVMVPLKFVANRPFIYAIRDTQTGAILFTGVVNDPSA